STDDNIGVVARDTDNDGTADGLRIQLAKDLTGLNSITIGGGSGQTVINGGDITTVNLTATGTTKLGDTLTINQDGTTDYDVTIDNSAGDTSLVNQKYVDGIGDGLVTDGLNLTGDLGDPSVHRDLGATLAITGGQTDASELSDDANIG